MTMGMTRIGCCKAGASVVESWWIYEDSNSLLGRQVWPLFAGRSLLFSTEQERPFLVESFGWSSECNQGQENFRRG